MLKAMHTYDILQISWINKEIYREKPYSYRVAYRFRPKSFSFIFNEGLNNLLLLKFFKIIFQTKIRQNLNELKFMSI
jgi:hypothetical protein